LNVAILPIEYWINELENNKTFSFVKANHGIFDTMLRTRKNINPNNLKLKDLPLHMFNCRHKNNKLVSQETYCEIIKSMLRNTYSYDKSPENFYVGISNSNGIWTVESTPRNIFINKICKNSKRSFLHGGLIRRYSISGEIFKLFDYLNSNNFNVNVIGADYCSNYNRFFKNMNHIKIPIRNALNDIDLIIDKAKNQIKDKEKNIFFVTLTTGSFYFCEKMQTENCTVIDIGRAFDWLIQDIDYAKSQPWIKKDILKKGNHLTNKIKKYDNLLIEINKTTNNY